MASNTITFFCIEEACSAKAHVYGGRCDDCFEEFIKKLRSEHNPHRCSVDFNHELGHVICDFRDDLHQPEAPPQKCCADGGVKRIETEPILYCEWYCSPCWKVRFGHPPSNDALLSALEKFSVSDVEEECLGCAGPSTPGANGYCSGCWEQRYGIDDS